jgi:hypothetical protein
MMLYLRFHLFNRMSDFQFTVRAISHLSGNWAADADD